MLDVTVPAYVTVAVELASPSPCTVAVTLELTDTTSREILWADRLTAPLDGIDVHRVGTRHTFPLLASMRLILESRYLKAIAALVLIAALTTTVAGWQFKAIAKETRGEYFYAGTAADLKKVYDSLSTRLVVETKETEISALFAALLVKF